MSWYDFMTNKQYLAQVGHFLGGAWVVFLGGILGGPLCLLYVWGIWLVATSVKEFVFDIVYEKDGWKNSWQDWQWWQYGEAAGAMMYWILLAMGRLAVPHGVVPHSWWTWW